jgi:hypothetical protein
MSNESIENYIADNPEKLFLSFIVSVHGPPKVRRLGENERRRTTCYRAQFRNGTEIWLPVGYLRQDPMISIAIDMDNVKRRAQMARSQSLVYSTTMNLVPPASPVPPTRTPQPVTTLQQHTQPESTGWPNGPDLSFKLEGDDKPTPVQEQSHRNGVDETILGSWGNDCDLILKKLERFERLRMPELP